jgi:xanthine dehydrogenase accessory factor
VDAAGVKRMAPVAKARPRRTFDNMSVTEVRGFLRECAMAGEPVGVAVLLRAWRSAPRAPGARFAAGPGTATAGSISAGCVEADLCEHLSAAALGAPPGIVRYGISDSDATAVGLSCGGEIELLVQAHDPKDPVWRRLEDVVGHGEEAVLGTALSDPVLGRRMLLTAAGDTVGSLGDAGRDAAFVAAAEQALAEESATGVAVLGPGLDVFLEPVLRPHHLVVVGATPLALALADLAAPLGIRLTIVEPRETLAARARESEVTTIQAMPDEAFGTLNLDRRSAVAVVAHDERLDVAALLTALRAGAGYVGLLGGRRTQRLRRESLKERGVAAGQIERIQGPIGLDIGAESPGEIALSILAQVVRHWSTPKPKGPDA